MYVKEWVTAEFLNKIEYLKNNEDDKIETLNAIIIMFYGNRTTSSFVDSVVDGTVSDSYLASAINLLYSDKWKVLKDFTDSNISITGRTDTEKETTENDIYGYNGDSAKDYVKTVTRDKTVEYDDIFSMLQSNVDIRNKLSYYKVVVSDIASCLATDVYD